MLVTARNSQIALMMVVAGAVAAGAALYYPFTSAAEQQHNLSLARQHAEKLAPKLLKDARFCSVRAVESARNGGTLLLTGTVANDADLKSLREILETSTPPVGVTWSVEVLPPDATTAPTPSM